jgi:GNAT superfamily N-acetyltransferase/very-short-patch-repair endonuclease
MQQEHIAAHGQPLCACGCQTPVRFKRGVPSKWVLGHQGKNAPITAAVSAQRAQAAKINWQRNRDRLTGSLLRFAGPKSAAQRQRLSQAFSTPEAKQRLRQNALTCWANPAYREKNLAATLAAVRRDAYRAKQGQMSRARWQDPQYRAKMAASWNLRNTAKSKLEDVIAQILAELGIKYVRQYRLGYWLFDLYLPDHKTLLEINGDYWHGRPECAANDTRKYAYVHNYFPDLSLRVIWEHEFCSAEALQHKIQQMLGLKPYAQADFDFSQVAIKACGLKDVDAFLTKYHYLRGIGNNAHAYGAFLGEKLIAVCAFASITRHASACKADPPRYTKELSRFCIHPSYHKRNFGSWLIARCCRALRQDAAHVRYVITYADETAGHSGALYSAAGFRFISDVEPGYWYMDGIYVVHKKTVWDNAKKMGMTEDEYARKYCLIKTLGKGKKKFLLDLLAD